MCAHAYVYVSTFLAGLLPSAIYRYIGIPVSLRNSRFFASIPVKETIERVSELISSISYQKLDILDPAELHEYALLVSVDKINYPVVYYGISPSNNALQLWMTRFFLILI